MCYISSDSRKYGDTLAAYILFQQLGVKDVFKMY